MKFIFVLLFVAVLASGSFARNPSNKVYNLKKEFLKADKTLKDLKKTAKELREQLEKIKRYEAEAKAAKNFYEAQARKHGVKIVKINDKDSALLLLASAKKMKNIPMNTNATIEPILGSSTLVAPQVAAPALSVQEVSNVQPSIIVDALITGPVAPVEVIASVPLSIVPQLPVQEIVPILLDVVPEITVQEIASASTAIVPELNVLEIAMAPTAVVPELAVEEIAPAPLTVVSELAVQETTPQEAVLVKAPAPLVIVTELNVQETAPALLAVVPELPVIVPELNVQKTAPALLAVVPELPVKEIASQNNIVEKAPAAAPIDDPIAPTVQEADPAETIVPVETIVV